MSRRQAAFALLQKTGKSLMLPVSVLPVAGLLLGVGSAHFTWLPPALSNVMAQSGGAIFSNLPLIFAIGVALGVTQNDGVAALAAVVGYAVMLATMGVMAGLFGYKPASIMGIESIETGVFGGIVAGSLAGWLFNKYYRIQLPPYLGFFAGKRSVPIVTAVTCMAAGIVLSIVWPPIGRAIDAFSHWAASGNPALAFALYGVVERALLPFGLHHIWNVPFFFEVGQYLDPTTGTVIRGEIHRFTAGDPTAGNMAGGYLFKMWGLPAAAIAMWHSARPENRAKVGGIMLSAALTSFLTGITEPIEFSFLFVAPVLYAVHAVLAAVAYVTCIELGIKHGMTFSHGLIDFIVLFNRSSHALWFLVIGPIWALIYYGLFRWGIQRFDLKTPGREEEEDVDVAAAPAATAGGLAGIWRSGEHPKPRCLHHAAPRAGGQSRPRQSRSTESARGHGRRRSRRQPAGDLRYALRKPEKRHGSISSRRRWGRPVGTAAGSRRGRRASALERAGSGRGARRRLHRGRLRRRRQYRIGRGLRADARACEGRRSGARQRSGARASRRPRGYAPRWPRAPSDRRRPSRRDRVSREDRRGRAHRRVSGARFYRRRPPRGEPAAATR
jgi:glucose PTS system EIICB or EIICBA component